MVKKARTTTYRIEDNLHTPGVSKRIADFMSYTLGQPIPENIIIWTSCTADGSTYSASIRVGKTKYFIEVFKSARDDTLSTGKTEIT